MKKLISFSLLLAIVAITNHVMAQDAKFSGTWEFVKPPIKAGEPFFTILRTFNNDGTYIQVRVTDKGTFVWQTAKIEAIDNENMKEIVDYCFNPANRGKAFVNKYQFLEDNKKNKLLVLRGGNTKVVDGVEVFEWQELWRKVEPLKQP